MTVKTDENSKWQTTLLKTVWISYLHSNVLPTLILMLQASGSGTDQMTTERQACGLGSFLPMSCRGRAEAFARRLQSRLQSLGRAGSRDGASSPADENSWLTGQLEVTSHQPRLSSSSESDIYFDFDLDCESPGSPIEEPAHSEILQDYAVNKSRAFHCPPKTQYSSESGCVSSSTVTGTSPDSDSSDGLYYDPENLDSEVASNHQNRKHEFKHDSSQEIGTGEYSHNRVPHTETNLNVTMNGHILGLKQESSSPDEEHRRVGKRNFRNAAGFRVSRRDKPLLVPSESDMKPISMNDLGSLSSEGSIADEYFECISSKPEECLSDYLKCSHDSGYPNTAESSRCNSQNESHENETNDCGSHQDKECSSVQNCYVSNGTSDSLPQRPNEISSETEHSQILSHPDIPKMPNSNEPRSTVSSDDEVKSDMESLNARSTDFPGNSNDDCSSSLSESLYTSTLIRPSKLTIECPIDLVKFDISEHKESTEPSDKKMDDDDDDDDVNRPTPRVRRCSSLKSGKTPPGTPGRKKIVRFADVLGLDLADVRTFLDEIPKVPRSAYEDLQCAELSDNAASSLRDGILSDVLVPVCMSGAMKPDRCLIPLFQQPGGQLDFMDRVRDDFVCLENAVVTDPVSYCISGTVRVRNLDFHKSVHVRYTLDGWKTFADLQATYGTNSCDGFSDKFSFILYAHTVQVGQRLEFAIRFQCRGGQYWDSNRGANYAFQGLPSADHTSYLALTMPMPMPMSVSPDDNISSSFY
ncbi:CBM21 domain-containing protein [Zootermopsis nevadensis]|uniref:CBM21 domain-containing protein n=2 Tax=Zootermopsis nevadensis TaxID=136037 RepID=A0A067QXL2_ZOONE|nr:CBM21 domain-containing protein [Zootermopsis nevadensis]